ncbi:MAG: hypothetical protein KGO96_06875 [Elusimicrobia bacterium]|nr:hypothetical protein [Elusimicrobiota bacterium]
MATALTQLQDLYKALEAGSYNSAPGNLVQGAALQVEELSPVMHNVTYTDKTIIIQKMLRVRPAKATLYQFDRQLSYGIFGGSAQIEGAVGQEETSQFLRVVVPMCYYSHIRRVTVVANMVATVDGQKAEDRAASDAAMKIAGDIEFDIFRGKADFSNAGVFDGNPTMIPALPNMLGLDPQVRQSDTLTDTQDLMFNEYGSNLSVVLAVGGNLSQGNIEDAAVRSAMNLGNADKLLVDPLVMAAYNKIAFQKERIFLAGSPMDATSADLRRQWVSGGVVQLEASRFLSGKTQPASPRIANGPPAATFTNAQSSGTTPFVSGQVYQYKVTAVNEIGESFASAASAVTISTSGNSVALTITPGSGTSRYFNVYRSNSGGTAASSRFIGRVANSGAATTVFTDLGNKLPGFVTGLLVQSDTMELGELAPYSRIKLAVSDLTMPEAHFRFRNSRGYAT